MASTVHSISVEAAFGRLGTNVRAALSGQVHDMAEDVARRMRQNAPKFENYLMNSIKANQVDEFAWEIYPAVDYARYVVDGIKPGGKGLPPYLSKGSESIVAWLQAQPRSGFVGPSGPNKKRKPRKGSKVFTAAMSDLRDRYYGLARHIRQFGIKAQPFVQQTYDEMKPVIRPRLMAAVQAAMLASVDASGSNGSAA